MKWTEKIKEKWQNSDGDERFEMIFIPLALTICSLLMIMAIIGLTISIITKSNAETTEGYCVVEDKDAYLQKAGNITLYKHCLYVTMDGSSDEELYKVQVSSGVYQDIKIGDTIKCIIFYDDNGICDIQLWEPGLVEEDDYE